MVAALWPTFRALGRFIFCFTIGAIPVSPASAVRVSDARFFYHRQRNSSLSQIFPCFFVAPIYYRRGNRVRRVPHAPPAKQKTKQSHHPEKEGDSIIIKRLNRCFASLVRSRPTRAPPTFEEGSLFPISNGRTWWCIRNQKTLVCRSRACFEFVMRSCLFRGPSAAHPRFLLRRFNVYF